MRPISRLYGTQSTEDVFLDKVVEPNSLVESSCPSSESDSETSTDDDSVDEVSYSSSSSSEWEEDIPAIDQLDISHDDDFLAHTSKTDKYEHNSTSTEDVDMDITSQLELDTIEVNVPVKLLRENYHRDMAEDLADVMKLVNEQRFICNVSKVKELFILCREKDCSATVESIQESSVGCTLKIIRKCRNGHCGTWHSSESIKKVYVNNILVAASLLFSGNNITKMSLFAKCLELGVFSKSS